MKGREDWPRRSLTALPHSLLSSSLWLHLSWPLLSGDCNQPFLHNGEILVIRRTYCVLRGGSLSRTIESAERQGVRSVVFQRSEHLVVHASFGDVERTSLRFGKQQREYYNGAQGAQHDFSESPGRYLRKLWCLDRSKNGQRVSRLEIKMRIFHAMEKSMGTSLCSS